MGEKEAVLGQEGKKENRDRKMRKRRETGAAVELGLERLIDEREKMKLPSMAAMMCKPERSMRGREKERERAGQQRLEAAGGVARSRRRGSSLRLGSNRAARRVNKQAAWLDFQPRTTTKAAAAGWQAGLAAASARSDGGDVQAVRSGLGMGGVADYRRFRR